MSGAASARSVAPQATYEPGAALDEAFDEEGRPWPSYAELLGKLAGTDLEDLRRRVNAHLEEAGVTFGGEGPSRTFPVDPVPRLIAAQEWERISTGLVQRTRALSAFLADAYGERRMVSEGRIPARVIDSARYFEPWMRGAPVSPPGFVAGLDLVRGSDGALSVLEDNTRTPSGLAYAVAARRALDAELDVPTPAGRLDVTAAYSSLRRALLAAAPERVDEPHAVLLSDGPANSAWHEHEQMGAGMGIPVITRDELTVRAVACAPGRRAQMTASWTCSTGAPTRIACVTTINGPRGWPTWCWIRFAAERWRW
ncbi:MAG: circularly permuted type 2 ATP-grasp protein [Thermoleophilaceae bacterium]